MANIQEFNADFPTIENFDVDIGEIQQVSGGGGTSDFDRLSNRPQYNGAAMTHNTDIPEVKTAAWDGKQDAISDLDTIRAGAVAGATAVQPEAGKGLSSNDYTNTEKTKLSGIADGATAVTESTVSNWGFTKNTGTYSKPTGGIPKSDMAGDVQSSLSKADSALQSHQSLAAYRTAAEQDLIDAGKGTYSKPTGGIPKSDLESAVQTSLSKADSALQEHQSLAAYRTAAEQTEIDAGKVDKNQGAGNVGKYLTIGADGNVTLTELPLYDGGVS